MDPIPSESRSHLLSKGSRSGAVALTVKKALECLASDRFCDCSSANVKNDVVYIVGPGQDRLDIPYLVGYYAGDEERFLVRCHEGLGWEIRRLFGDRERLDGLEHRDPPV